MNNSSKPNTVLQRLEFNAHQKPDETAFVFLEGIELEEAGVSYGELVKDAKLIAASLLQKVKKGERAILLFPPGLDYIRTLMACFYAGVIAVPLFPPRAREKSHRLANVLIDSEPTLVLSNLSVKPALDHLFNEKLQGKQYATLYTDELLVEQKDSSAMELASCEFDLPSPEDVAFLQYTSGSTGAPKGVMVTHANIVANLQALESTTGCHSEDIFVNWLPLFHDLGLINTVFLPIYLGSQSVLMAPGTFIQSPECWFEAIRRYRGTICGAPNFAYELCTQRISEDCAYDLSSWRIAFNAAEPIRLDTLNQFAAKFKNIGFNRNAIYPSYGMAEATVFLCGGTPQQFPATHQFQDSSANELVSCGSIAKHHELIIVDPNSKQILENGKEGEIWVSGPSIAKGYWNKEEVTEEIFYARPLNSQQHYLRTGDLGLLSQGQLYVTGRIKELIILNGQNYYPNDIEYSAQQAHTDLVMGKGAAISFEQNGVEKLVLVQEIKRTAMRRANQQDIFAQVSQSIGNDHQLVLQELLLIKQGALPLTSSGKIQRVLASDRFLQDGFADVTVFRCQSTDIQENLNEATTENEAKLCQLIQTLCNVSVTCVEQNFYQMGLDSLQQSKLLSQINLTNKLQLSLVDLTENNSVQQLARLIETQKELPTTALLPPVMKTQQVERGLSPMQSQLYSLWKSGLGGNAYTESKVFSLPSAVDLNSLESALEALLQKHALLRARVNDNNPPYLVCDSVADDIIRTRQFDDIQQAELAMAQERLHQFDLATEPMCRISLMTLPGRCYLQFTLHHIITDGWSLGLLIRDLNNLYQLHKDPDKSHSQQALAQATATNYEYKDYVNWLEEVDKGNYLDSQAVYWKKRLADLPVVHQLPLDHPRPAIQSYEGVNYSCQLSPLLSSKIDAFCRTNKVTPNVFMQTSFALLLSYLSGESDIVMGTVSAGRKQAQWQSIVGLFTNTLVSRVAVDEALSFTQLLQQHNSNLLQDFENQELSFEALINALKPARSPAYHPLFQIWFLMQNFEQEDLNLDGVANLVESKSDHSATKYDLALYITPVTAKNKQYVCQWKANSALFSQEKLEYFALQYMALIDACLSAPEKGCLNYDILKVDNAVLSHELNQVTSESAQSSLLASFDASVAKYPNQVAITDGDSSLTYHELQLLVDTFACEILASTSTNQVGLFFGQNLDMAVAVLATLRAGKTYVPLDPQLPVQRLRDICSDAQISLLLCNSCLYKQASELTANSNIPLFNVFDIQERQPEIKPHFPVRRADSVAYILYTSGSTGKPKGVYQCDKNVCYFAKTYSDSVGIESESQVLQIASFAFDASVMDFYGALLNGATLHIKDLKSTSRPKLQHYIKQAQISLFHSTPTVFKYLFCEFKSHHQLQAVVLGGEALDNETLKVFQNSCSENCLLVNGYGPTESTLASQRHIRLAEDGTAASSNKINNIGQSVAGTSLILRNKQGKKCRVFEAGEIHIVSPYLAIGYWNNPELTESKFTDISNGSRQYATGDVGRYLPDGSIEYMARKDDQIKLNGIRIELAEIKQQLDALPAVMQAAVQLKDLPGLGLRLVSYLQTEQSSKSGQSNQSSFSAATVQAFRTQLAKVLPDYMLPSFFVALADFPRTASGKVDHSRLPMPALNANNPQDNNAQIDGKNAVDMSKTTDQLLEIWQGLLNSQQVQFTDNFFDIGGNSLLMMQLQQAIHERFTVEISVTELFTLPTINAQAERLKALSQQLSQEESSDISQQLTVAKRAESNKHDIAIIGLSGQFPGAANVDEFWQNIQQQVESIQHFDKSLLREQGVAEALLQNPDYVASGALLDELELFDEQYFAMSPKEASLTCPQQRLLLENAVTALEHAGYGNFDNTQDVGVFVGTGHSMYMLENLLQQKELIASLGPMAILNANSRAAMRISYKLNLSGPSINVDTACSTSAVAVAQACDSLVNQNCTMALAGGASVTALSPTGYLHEAGGIKSKDGHCRVFDEDATGTVFGSGCGLLVLKRLDDAMQDGDKIHAIIKGWAVNNDASDKVGYTAPSSAGQAQAIRQALQHSGLQSSDIGYVETHGTGTKLGDPIEIAALSNVFDIAEDQESSCALGAVKANIGHLDAAAGIAGIIKTTQALKNKVLPGNINFKQLNSAIDLKNKPFYVNTESKAWTTTKNRAAGVSSFGIGGTNAHLVLQEAPQKIEVESNDAIQLLPISGKTKEALQQNLLNLKAWLGDNSEVNLQSVASTLQTGRQHHAWRKTVAGNTVAQLQSQLSSAIDAVENSTQSASEQANLVFMFAGQGTQTIDMGRDLYQQNSAFAGYLNECATIFQREMQLDIIDLLFPKQAYAENQHVFDERFADTAKAQPAIFAIEYALAKIWIDSGIEPHAVIGHSLGEYTAACFSGVMSLEDACSLVAVRSQLMAKSPAGAMLSVVATRDTAQQWSEKFGLSIAVVNGPNRIVLSGTDTAVKSLEAHLTEQDISCSVLKVAKAFHSPLMDAVLPEFSQAFKEVQLKEPKLAMVSNLTGEFVQEGTITNSEYWCRHLRGTVEFSAGLELLLNHYSDSSVPTVFIEIGPGCNLSSLLARIQKDSNNTNAEVLCSLPSSTTQRKMESSATNQLGMEQQHWLNALGAIWCQGAKLNWPSVTKVVHKVALPTYAFQKQRHWIDAPKQASQLPILEQASHYFSQQWRPESLSTYEPNNFSDSANWLIFNDGSGYGAVLAHMLEEQGETVVCVEKGTEFSQNGSYQFTVNSGAEEDYARLMQTLKSQSWAADNIIYLWPLDEQEKSDLSALATTSQTSQLELLRVYQAITKHNQSQPVECYIVTQGDAIARDQLSILGAQTGLSALCQVISQEDPLFQTHQIDADRHGLDGDFVSTVLAELMYNTKQPVVAYRDDIRMIPDIVELPCESAASYMSSGCYVITGGLGRIGLSLAQQLADKFSCDLVLLTRQKFPQKDSWSSQLEDRELNTELRDKLQKIVALEREGVTVSVVQADVTDLAQLRETLEGIQKKFGHITGILHGAGQVEGLSKLTTQLTNTELTAQAQPKITGALNIRTVTQDIDVDFVVLMSSISSVLGGLGYGAYAAANALMDRIAFAEHNNSHTRWRTINWDTWLFDSSQGAKHSSDITGMNPDRGLDVIEAALAQPEAQLIYAAGDLQARLNKWVYRNSEAPIVSSQSDTAETLANAMQPQQQSPHAIILHNIWQELLGVEHIAPEDTFFDLGGDSLLATRLVSLIRQRCEVEVSIEEVYQSADFAGLAKLLEEQESEDALPEIVAVSRREPLPLSYSQQRLWFIDQLEAEQSHYVMPSDFELQGPLDVQKLQQVFTVIIQRHEVLRTCFNKNEQTATQNIREEFELPFTQYDVSALDAAGQQQRISQLFENEAAKPFNLSCDILFRATLIKRASDNHRLLITMHHIASDGWSRQIFVEELIKLYTGESVDAAILPTLPIQYADFAHWQRENLNHRVMQQELDYWGKQLEDAPAIHSFPLDRERPEKQSFAGNIQQFEVSSDLVAQLRKACEQHNVTLFMYLQTVFAILVSRYSQHRDVVMGTAVSGRSHAELSDLIGFFVNTLVLRSDFSGELSFSEALAGNKDMITAAFSNQQVPFDQVVEHLNPERSLGYNTLFQIMFSMQTSAKTGAELGELVFTPKDINNTQAKFDIELDVTDLGESLMLRWRYSTALFDDATITRVANNFLTLLSATLQQPDNAILALPLVSDSELQLIDNKWNNVNGDYPLEKTVNELFEAQAQMFPDNVAVIYQGAELSYRQLDERANQLAQHLLQQGVTSNQLVGIFMERSIEMMVAIFGILKAGAGYLPLDVAYPLARLEYMLNDSGTQLILTQVKHQAVLEELAVEVMTLDSTDTVSLLDTLDSNRPKLSADLASHERLAYVIYTSGSTGMPKGVSVNHRSVNNFLSFSKQHFMLPHIDGAIVSSPLTFDATVGSILVPLVAGGYAELLPENDMILEVLADYLLDDEESLLFKITPAHLEALSGQDILNDNPDARHVVVVAGEALRENVIQPWRKAQPNTLFINEYGPTEATVGSTIYKFPTNSLDKGWDFTVPIGGPIENSRLYVMNENLVQQPVGVVGELYITGEGLAAGYLNRQELNAERFVQLKLATGNIVRAYRTGDLVRWNNTGNIEFFGRTDHQVKLRGFRVELDEIQAKLLSNDNVQACLVTDYKTPDDTKKLAAYISLDKTQFNRISEQKGEEIVDNWQEVHDEFYDKDDHNLGVEANFSGWNSSYTGEPIVVEQMMEWLDITMSRILALKPKHMLEIGSGAGLLLYRYAEHCDSVTALDISHQAITMMQRNLDDKNWGHVSLFHDDATGIESFETGEFDTVVLNSVVQYFPNEEYLTQIIEQAIAKTVDGGHIFIGDIRNLDLFEPHLATVEAYRLQNAECQASAFAQRVQRAKLQEHELLISPTYFNNISDKLHRISNVDIKIKLGDGDNELMRYRYDVVIHVGSTTQKQAEINWQSWKDTDTLRQILMADESKLVGVHSVPNDRVTGAVDLVRDMKHWPATKKLDSKLFSQYTHSDASLLNEIEEITKALNYQVSATWSQTRSQHLDFIFWQGEPPVVNAHAEYRYNQHTNLTNISKLCAGLSSDLNQFLAEHLPEFMLPDIYVFMEQFPLTPNGKVDRKALPTPDETDLLKEQFQAPETDTQKQICQLWEELLQVNNIGINDNFFSLGGDSVTSIQMVSKARTLGLPMKVRDLFENQTVSALAAKVEQNRGQEGAQELSLDWVNKVLSAQQLGSVRGDLQLTLTPLTALKTTQDFDAIINGIVQENPLIAGRLMIQQDDTSLWLPVSEQQSEQPSSIAHKVVNHIQLEALPDAQGIAQLVEQQVSAIDLPIISLYLLNTETEGFYLLTLSHNEFIGVMSIQAFLQNVIQLVAAGANSFKPEPVKGKQQLNRLGLLGKQLTQYMSLLSESNKAHKLEVSRARCMQLKLSTQQTALLLGETNNAYQTEASELLMAAMHHALSEVSSAENWQLNAARNLLELASANKDNEVELFRLPLINRLTGSEVHLTEPGELIKNVKECNRKQLEQGVPLLSVLGPLSSLPASPALNINFHYISNVLAAENKSTNIALPVLANAFEAINATAIQNQIDVHYWYEEQQLCVQLQGGEHALMGSVFGEFESQLQQSLTTLLEHCQLVNSLKLKATLEQQKTQNVDDGETFYL